jgi:hypothetical protein
MTVVVFTSDKYIELLKGFSLCFNRHWSEEQEVLILGFKSPEFDLPDNFKFVSVGNQDDFEPYAFCKPFRPIIETLEEEIVMFLEDCFLIRKVDLNVLGRAESLITKGHVQRVDMFWGCRSQYEAAVTYTGDDDFLEYPQDMAWRVTMSPGIVHKERLLKHFNDDYNIWQAEKIPQKYARNDGAVLLCGKAPIAPWVNVVDKGRFNAKYFYSRLPSGEFDWNPHLKIEEEDMNVIEKYVNWSPGGTIE